MSALVHASEEGLGEVGCRKRGDGGVEWAVVMGMEQLMKERNNGGGMGWINKEVVAVQLTEVITCNVEQYFRLRFAVSPAGVRVHPHPALYCLN